MHTSSITIGTPMPLETEATAEIRALLAGLKPDDADMLEALHRVQHRYGYVSQEAMHVIAEQLRVTPAHVYGVTTYYSDYRTTPPPAVTVAWCSGPACRLRNGAGIRDAMQAVLGIELGEDTPDGRVGLVLGQCNGTCEQAPQVWVGERVVGKLTAARAVTLARALRDGADPDNV
jgi:NADH-quinone oxidoreductase subunit E/NADP-reducing hydrogenase subunit HndA